VTWHFSAPWRKPTCGVLIRRAAAVREMAPGARQVAIPGASSARVLLHAPMAGGRRRGRGGGWRLVPRSGVDGISFTVHPSGHGSHRIDNERLDPSEEGESGA